MKILTKKCIVCGKEFAKPYSCGMPEWNNKRKFCSAKCSNAWKKGKHFSPKSEFSKERHYIPNTAIKKKQRLSPDTEFKKGQSPWNKGIRPDKRWYEKMKKAGFFDSKWGDKSGNWKGGVTELGAAIRTMTMYREAQNKCLKRDDYTCQRCGTRSKKGLKVYLNCHHKKPFYKILEENKITTIEEAKNCYELWDVSNLETLCVRCHKKTESYLRNL
jgi:hypothetical protein